MNHLEFTGLMMDPRMGLPKTELQRPKACSKAIALVVPADAGIQSTKLFIKVTPSGI